LFSLTQTLASTITLKLAPLLPNRIDRRNLSRRRAAQFRLPGHPTQPSNWKVQAVVVDATGVGAGIASFLSDALGDRCIPFIFSSPSKSALGYELLSAVGAGRLKQ